MAKTIYTQCCICRRVNLGTWIKLNEEDTEKLKSNIAIGFCPECQKTNKIRKKKLKNNKKVIYTVLIGDYENELHEAPDLEDWDCIAFVSDMSIKDRGWTLKELEISKPLGVVRTSRLPRILPHLFLDDKYEESIYIDASVILESDPSTWKTDKGNLRDHDCIWGVAKHWERQCVWQEFIANDLAEKTHPDTLREQEAHYKKLGLEDARVLLNQNSVIYRKHKDPRVIEACADWWKYFCQHTCRDQLSFPMAVAETGIKRSYIQPDPTHGTSNPNWKIIHSGKHKTIYKRWPLYFLISNTRGSAISRGLQVGKCLFDRGVRNKVFIPSYGMEPVRNSVIIIVKEMRRELRQLKEQGNKLIFDIVDNSKVWENGLTSNIRFLDGCIFPNERLVNEWQEKGYEFPERWAVIEHHWDYRFEPNAAEDFSPVCICTHTQIPDVVHELGVDCITEGNGWDGLFKDALNYNLHIGVYRDDMDYMHKPATKLITAAGCMCNVILQRTPSNMALLPDHYPYYVDSEKEIPEMLEKCRRDYYEDGQETWMKALQMIEEVQVLTCGGAIAAEYEEFLREKFGV